MDISYFATPYHRSLKPNCTWRDDGDVVAMTPAVPDTPLGLPAVGGANTIRFGVLKFARFKILKISARN